MLKGVTITGADDSVEPSWLAYMSEKHHFVEWGILHSLKRRGTARYPSKAWLCELDMMRLHWRSLRLSAHLCGQMSRDTLGGDARWLFGLGSYRRVQLNGYEPSSLAFMDMLRPTKAVCMMETKSALLHRDVEFVLQVREEAHLQETASLIEEVRQQRLLSPFSALLSMDWISVLYDPSGGRGLEPFSWPVAPLGLKLGYAGGIKPSNLEQVLGDIGPVSHDFWIDMESGVRAEEDVFDQKLATEVLEKASRFING